MYIMDYFLKLNLPDFPTLSVPRTTTLASILCPFSLVMSFTDAASDDLARLRRS